jgi:hypothetical protein
MNARTDKKTWLVFLRRNWGVLLVGVPTTFFYTSRPDAVPFPEDYEILVLKAESDGLSDGNF